MDKAKEVPLYEDKDGNTIKNILALYNTGV